LTKEILVGTGNGIATGAIAALVAWLLYGDPSVGMLLAIALVINLFVAGMAGTLIPLGLKALKFDPALVSTVFITTFTDVCGFASFLGLATLFTRYFHRAG
jgi:magnesium transporter